MSEIQKYRRPFTESFYDYATRSFPVAIFYLAVLTVAEVIAVLISPVTGVLLHMAILFMLTLHASFTWSNPIHRFLLPLTLVPLIRVISLSLPLTTFPLTYWFFITSVPLLAAAYVIQRELKFTWREVIGFSWRGLPVQILIASTGILLGYVEYTILKPEPLIVSLSWQELLIPALILLVSTGFLEEYIFRFLLQRTSIERLGVSLGIIYVALFFAVLHIGYQSVTDFLFVLFVGLIFGVLAYKTRSILGVTIAHGLTNIMLFLVMPFIIASTASAIETNLKPLLVSITTVPAVEQLVEQQNWDINSYFNLDPSAELNTSEDGDLNPLVIDDPALPGEIALDKTDANDTLPVAGQHLSSFRVIEYGDISPNPE